MSDLLPTEPWQAGYLAAKHFGGDRWAVVADLTFGRARVMTCNQYEVFDGW